MYVHTHTRIWVAGLVATWPVETLAGGVCTFTLK